VSGVGIGRAAGAVTALAALAAAAALCAPAARADGDPASDYLLLQNVFLPMEAPSQAAATALDQAVSGVYAHGDRVKVAVIFAVGDMGAVPTLFGKPDDYAQFLGVELSLWYVGPLLIAMPNGYGIYDGGRSTAAEDAVLRSLPLEAATPDELVRGAAAAVQRLEAAGALHSPDITAPLVTADPAKATLGHPVTLHFDVFDDSGRSKAVVRVYENNAAIATLSSPMAFAIGTRHATVRWPVPAKLESRRLRFCVVATDSSGNESRPSCAPFIRIG
jgi:hypothetical protein